MKDRSTCPTVEVWSERGEGYGERVRREEEMAEESKEGRDGEEGGEDRRWKREEREGRLKTGRERGGEEREGGRQGERG